MDLNYLYRRHQVSLMMAESASSSCAHLAHLEMAKAYATRIAEARPLSPSAAHWASWQADRAVPCPCPATVLAGTKLSLTAGQ